MDNQKKMPFYEIGKGRYAMLMQEEFERAQQIAFRNNAEVKVTSVIKIIPPEEGEAYGQIEFQVKLGIPARKSLAYTTEIKNGMIVSEGDDINDIMQEELKFPDLVTLNQKTGEIVQ